MPAEFPSQKEQYDIQETGRILLGAPLETIERVERS
jgi:hypothetical protein